MEGPFLLGLVDTRILRVESTAHRVTPIMVKIIPTTGKSGIIGQRMIRIRLIIPPTIIMRMPVRSKTRREKKPTMREIRRSRNM